MNWKKTLGMLVVFIALFFVAHYTLTKKEQTDEKEEAEKKVYDIKSSDVTQLEIKSEAGLFAFKKDAEGNWGIEKPFLAEADSPKINGIIKNIEDLEIAKTIEIKDQDLKIYGLTKPKIELKFKVKGDEQEKSILLGNKSPDDKTQYVLKGADKTKVCLAGLSLDNVSDNKLKDFREKKIFKFKKDDVNKVSIKNKLGKFELAKQENWQIEKPIKFAGDKIGTEKAINAIANLKVEEFASEKAKNLGKYGLKNPEIKAEFELKDSKLAVSVSKKGEKYYLKRGDRENIYEINESVFKNLNIKLADIIKKKLVEVDTDKVKKIKLTLDSKTKLNFSKNEKGKWIVEDPEMFRVKESKIKAVLRQTKSLQIDELKKTSAKNLDKYGLVNPSKMIYLITEDDKKVGIKVGKSFKKDKDTFYYIANFEADNVFTIKENKIKSIFPKKGDLTEKKIFATSKWSANELVIKEGDEVCHYVKDKENHKWEKKYKGKRVAEPKEIQDLLGKITGLKANTFLQKEDSLDKPGFEIKLTNNSDDIEEVVFGKGEENKVYGKIVSENLIFEVEVAELDKIKEIYKKES